MRRRAARPIKPRKTEPIAVLIKVFVVFAMIATFLVAALAIRSAKTGKEKKDKFPSYLKISPEELNFGAVPYGKRKALKVRITNTGQNKIYFSKILSSTTEFYLPSRFPGKELGKDESTEFAVIFRPGYPGEIPGKVTVESSDVGEQFIEIPCKGYGVMPKIKVHDSEIDLTHVQPGYELIREVIISNDGTSGLIIRSLNAGSDRFEIKGSIPASPLQPGQYVIFKLHYRPGPVAERNTLLTIVSNDPVTPTTRIVLITKKDEEDEFE